ncbi:MAG: cupin domain-containing protein [Opitutaceae bacterium]
MKIFHVEDRATTRGNPEYFTGTVWLDQIALLPPPFRLKTLRVSFEPGARTAWHTHPLGQVLHILSGVGRVQRAGESVLTVKPGDTVIIDPGERHWHGAAPGHAMVHIAMQGVDENGSDATWFEHVADA